MYHPVYRGFVARLNYLKEQYIDEALTFQIEQPADNVKPSQDNIVQIVGENQDFKGIERKENVLIEASATLTSRTRASNSTWLETATFDIEARQLLGAGAFNLRYAMYIITESFLANAVEPFTIWYDKQRAATPGNDQPAIIIKVRHDNSKVGNAKSDPALFVARDPDTGDKGADLINVQITNAFNVPQLPLDDWYVAVTSFECQYILPKQDVEQFA